MKKFVVLLSALVLTLSYAEAKDYVKMQVKEMQHAQKYGTTQKVLQNKVQEIRRQMQASVCRCT